MNFFKSLCLIAGVIVLNPNSLSAQKKTSFTVTSMSPDTVGLGGGSIVTITGTKFDSKKVPQVFFGTKNGNGGTASPNVNVLSSTTITAETPMTGIVGSDSVTVVVGNTRATLSGQIHFSLPVISSISPNSGSLAGGDTITIKGKYLNATQGVKFGNPFVGTLTNSDTEITVITPNYKAGEVQVQAQVQGKSSDTTSASKFTYENEDKTYTISLKNFTGLDKNHKVYVLGYSTKSKKIITVDSSGTTGKFQDVSSITLAEDSGYVQSYELGKHITEIEVSNSNPIDGARIYFFVANTLETYKDNSKKTPNSNLGFWYYNKGASVRQVQNPPQTDFPQYSYIEATFLQNESLYTDVSTVDGFFFPLSIAALDKNGKELSRVGQPAGISSQEIISAYTPFINDLIAGGESVEVYHELLQEYDNLKILLNPGLQLQDTNSTLETVFDSTLNALFTDASLNMSFWQNGGSDQDFIFKVTPVKDTLFPGTTNKHDALLFKNKTKTYCVYNPVGFSVVSYEEKNSKTSVITRKPITGSIKKDTLTFTNPLPATTGLKVGMYVSSGYGSVDDSTTITNINMNSANVIVSVNLVHTKDYPALGIYQFAKAPTYYYASSGEMAFAGSGLLNDGAHRYGVNDAVVVNGFENQISTALNRGVAIGRYQDSTNRPNTHKNKLSSVPGYTTYNWAIETNWYPKGQAQNYFSYFLHTAMASTVNGKMNIFAYPDSAVTSARLDSMSMAYGFAYDENPIHSVPGPQVPSEYSGEYPKGTTSLQIELGLWYPEKKKKK